MKIKLLMFTAAGLCLTIIVIVVVMNWNKHLLFMRSGEIIEADKSWIVFDEIFYEQGEGALYTIKRSQVDHIAVASIFRLPDWRYIFAYQMRLWQEDFDKFENRSVWGWMLGGIGGLTAFFFIGFSLFRYLKKESVADEKNAKTRKNNYRRIHISPQIEDSKKILLYFLNLYLLQTKTGLKDRYEYRCLDIQGPLNTSIYEFKVEIGGKWRSRRISIGRIGEESGARSKCFYVIYDDHLVIKIPPEPISDFNEYIQDMMEETHIAEMMAPKECLVPRLSVVLNQIPDVKHIMAHSSQHNEKQYIDLLNRVPEFTEFLKIGGSYAFFMDLSQYFFLGEILKEIHDIRPIYLKEIKQYQNLIWTPATFTDRYGEDAGELCLKFQEIYALFNERINDTDVPAYQKKTWFKSIFSNEKLSKNTVPNEIETMLRNLKDQHFKTFQSYKTLLEQYAREQSLKQNISRIENICSRLIDLLAWLFFKKIAIRDLKPDNLLVAGDPSKYPRFLNAEDEFELGLIDVEIAVHVIPGYQTSSQPKLGGTPFYATPSHMFLNEVIAQLFENSENIFFLQDWYAGIAMIYQAITDEKLFIQSANQMVRITREFPLYLNDLSKMSEFAERVSKQFWRISNQELKSKIREKKALLMSANLKISRKARKMFRIMAGQSAHAALRKKMLDMKSEISAYYLIQYMFVHIKKEMAPKRKTPLE